MRAKLKRKRLSSPLFDTARFAADIERGFDMIFERHMQGLPPAHLNVPARTEKGSARSATKVNAAA